MTLQAQFARFDTLIAEIMPDAIQSMQSGLDDNGIEELQRAVAPLRLGHDIEQLYRWHNGIALPIFGGNCLLSAVQIIESREFQIKVLERPPAWLQFTDGPAYLFATLDVPGCPADSSVWSGDTHDPYLGRMHDSLEAMIGSFNDMASDSSETVENRKEILLGSLRYGGKYRLARSPGSFTYPDPPAGTYLTLFEDGTPEPWLRSLGTSSNELLPRGATMTIAELRHAAETGPASATIQGIARNVGGPIRAINFTIDDGTGAVQLTAVTAESHLFPKSNAMIEVDVTMTQDGTCELVALRWLPE